MPPKQALTSRLPRRVGGSRLCRPIISQRAAGQRVHPRQQSALHDSARHAQERAHVQKHRQEQERRARRGVVPRSRRRLPACVLLDTEGNSTPSLQVASAEDAVAVVDAADDRRTDVQAHSVKRFASFSLVFPATSRHTISATVAVNRHLVPAAERMW